ncbi:MAG: amidase, partial [Cyanobacteria bacterium P01_A01_bin.135]
MDRLTELPAHQLAALVSAGETSALALVEAALAQGEAQSYLNAICTLNAQAAKDRARAADAATERGESWGPLHGVPITIKDLFKTQGLRTTAGLAELRDYIPTEDAPTVARLRQAGAIILGKTNGPQAGGDYQSHNALFGRTNNPWNRDRTPGGSSGGGAAAAAAGLSSLDLCSDYGGSIRLPAHFCGIYGLKPTDRLVPTAGHIPPAPGMPESIRQMLTVGLLARSLRDLRLGLKIIAGPTPAQPDIPPVPLQPSAPKPLTQLRLAWCQGIDPLWPQPDIQAAIAQAADQLSHAGATLQPFAPQGWDWEHWLRIYYRLSTLSLRYVQRPSLATLGPFAQAFRREWWQSDPEFRPLMAVRHALPVLLRHSLKDYFEAVTERDRLTAWLDKAMSGYDALLL